VKTDTQQDPVKASEIEAWAAQLERRWQVAQATRPLKWKGWATQEGFWMRHPPLASDILSQT
jgi:hypothetical protein